MAATAALRLVDLVDCCLPGDAAGRCYLCAAETTHGHRGPPSGNFTAWAQTCGGDVICERCMALLRDRRFRTASWLATPSGVRFTQREESRRWLWEALCDPPDPPLAVYLTRGGQKQSWISLMHCLTTSRERLWVGTDWTDRPVLLERAWVARVAPLVELLRARGLSRQRLVAGDYRMQDYRRAMADGVEQLLEEARGLVGDPRWEVLVYAHAEP